MMIIQKPKRMWQKKKDYNKKKLIRKIQRRNKTSFDDGKDRSYQDWKTKVSKYKHIDIDHDNTFDYEGFYNSDPDNAYRFLNDDPTAHFDDTYKTVYHPTFSDLSIYSGKVDPRFNPEGLKGGHWVNDHKYLSPKQSPVSMDERIGYLGEAEDNGVQLRTYDNQPIWLDDGTRWDGVLPQVIVKPDYQRGKDKSYSDLKMNRPIIIGPGLLSVITPNPEKYKKGKDCFDIGTDDGQQMIWQDGDQYFAGPTASSATTKVTPFIERLPNDKSTWDFVDDSGKLYTTKYSDDQLKQLYGQNVPTSEFYNWTDRSGKEHRQMRIIPVSPVDPIGEMAVETALGYPLFKGMSLAGGQLLKDYARDFAFTKLGNWARNKIAGKEAADVLNKNVSAWDGTVGPEYFDSRYNWYRWTETPEIQSIRRTGKNITTNDTDGIGGTPDSWRADAMDNFSKSKEGYWYKADKLPDDAPLREFKNYVKNPNKNIGFAKKYGSAHGNRSQGAYGRYWDGSLSTSGIGHLGLLEGDVGTKIPVGINRTTFVEKSIKNLIPGSRIGFKTGEMPMDNLSWFEKLPNGRFSYKGLVLPDKRIDLTPKFDFKKVYSQPRMQFDEPTYQMYTGRRFNISDIINKDKSINIDKLKEVYREALKNIPNGYTPQHRLENTKWHKTDWNTFLHSRDAYRRALEFNYPDEALFPTLMHDAGKLWTGDGHGPYGASIIRQMFPDATDEQIMAIYGHMTQEPYGTLGNLVKGADIHIPNKWRDLGLQQSQKHNSGKDIHIKKANRGKFTEAANEHNMGVQEFARQVLSAPKGKYSSTLRKRANFARNFAH